MEVGLMICINHFARSLRFKVPIKMGMRPTKLERINNKNRGYDQETQAYRPQQHVHHNPKDGRSVTNQNRGSSHHIFLVDL
jgi:hypothetical protein